MKRIDLKLVSHNSKTGASAGSIEPNIVDDAIFYLDGEPIGFYLKKMPDKMCKLANLANAELLSDRVPKTLMERIKVLGEDENGKKIYDRSSHQFSAIIGCVPAKPHMRRHYNKMSSVHSVKSAETFIKAMLLLGLEGEKLIKEILPKQYEQQLELFKLVQDKWKLGNLFTSSISNYNISAPYHRDNANIVGTVNIIICKKLNSTGGDLTVPDYDITIGQQDNSIIVYPAWKNLHAVTEIEVLFDGGYRNSLVFYPLKAGMNP